jgi:hypothetical protein
MGALYMGTTKYSSRSCSNEDYWSKHSNREGRAIADPAFLHSDSNSGWCYCKIKLALIVEKAWRNCSNVAMIGIGSKWNIIRNPLRN